MRTYTVVGLGILLGFSVAWAGNDAATRPATQSAAVDIPAERLFARLATMQDPSLAYTRDLLLARGQTIIPLLETEQRSEDWRRRLAAEALLLRLRDPERVAQWDQALRGHCDYQMSYGAIRDKPGQVTLKPNTQPAASVTLNRQAVPLLVEHLWLNLRDDYRGSGAETAAGRIVRLLGHLDDARAVEPVLLVAKREYRLRQVCEEALVAIGRPGVPGLLEGLKSDAAAEQPGAYVPRLWLICDVLGKIGDRAAAEPLMKLLAESPQHKTASVAAEALGALGAAEAAEPVAARFAQLLKTITSQNRGTYNGDEAFHGFYRALRKLSPGSAVAIKAQRQHLESVRWQFLLSGLEMELADAKRLAAYEKQFPADPMASLGRSEPEEVPVPDGELRQVGLGRLMVRAAWMRWSSWDRRWIMDAAAIGREKAPAALEFLLDSLRSPGAIEGLVQLRDARAVPPLAELLTIRGALGPEAARAIYRIEGAEALAALRRAASQAEESAGPESTQLTRELSRAFVLALEGKKDELAVLLPAESIELRHAAAEGLVRLGDERGAAVMLAQAAGSEGVEYLRLRELLLSLGERALPALGQAQDAKNPMNLRVAAEAIAIQISKPKPCRDFDKRLEEGWQRIAGMHVIRDETVFAAGKAAGGGQPKELAPYAESIVLFRLVPHDVSAGALAEFAREQSIPVLTQAVRRGLSSQLAALALHAFGEKGLEAAKVLPPPDPDKAAYAERSARSRAGTRALAMAQDPAGIDQIIEALGSTWRVADEPDNSPQATQRRYAWLTRTRAMVSAAGKYHDARLFEAMLKLYQSPDSLPDLRGQLLAAMVRYDDKRLVPVLKSVALTSAENSGDLTTALKALAERDDVDAMKFLLDSLAADRPEETRVAAVAAMHLLVRYHLPEDRRQEWAATAATRWEELLDDPSRAVQHRAAHALAERSIRAAAPRLGKWLSPEDPSPRQEVYQFLGRWGDKMLGPKLLRIFQNKRWWFVAEALGDLGYTEAASELASELRRPTKYQHIEPVARALVQLGPDGLKHAGAVLRDTRDRSVLDALMKAFHGQGTKAAGQWDIIAEKVALLGRGHDQAVDFGDLSPRDRTSAGRMLEEWAVKAMAAVDPRRSEPILRRLAVEHEDQQIRTLSIELLRRPGP